jgi:hypothetical protein
MGRSMKPEPFFKTRRYLGLPECMGGFCQLRSECPQHEQVSTAGLQERLCVLGQDGRLSDEDFAVVRIVPAGKWERKGAGLLAPAGPFDGLVA